MIAPPTLFTLTMSVRCNQDCIFCAARGDNRSDTALNMFNFIRSEITPGSVVDISGQGEILLHPKFRQIVQYIGEAGARCSFSTNGAALTPDLVDFIDTSSVHLINVSLNSLDRDIYRRLTGRDFLPKIRENLTYLFARLHPFKVSLSMVITAYNSQEILAFTQYGVSVGAASVRLLPLASTIQYYDPGIMPEDTPALREQLTAAINYAHAHKMHIQAFSLDPQVRGYSLKCRAPWQQIRIDLDGSVKTCCWSNRELGNMRTQSLREMWEGPLWNEFRQSVASGAMTFCQNCREFA